MRRLALLIIVFSIVAALVFVEKRPDTGRVGLNAVMRLVADFERQVERIPLTATRVSDSEETEVGRRLALHYHLSTTDPYLERVGQIVASRVNRKGIAYRFYLDDQAGVNAFALPGGQIVVGPGMLKLLESEDELAALLGHEITHVDRRHTIERFQYELAARKLGLSIPYALASIPIAIFRMGYTKELELEADRVGVELAAEAGYSPDAAVTMQMRFNEKQQTRPQTPDAEARRIVASGLTEYLRSHPPTAERVAEIRKEIAIHRWKPVPVRPLETRIINQRPPD